LPKLKREKLDKNQLKTRFKLGIQPKLKAYNLSALCPIAKENKV
jgi:hypothetical protein